MIFSALQKQVIREMVKRRNDDAYEAQVGSDDAFALSELANFKALRLNELAVDQGLIDTALTLYNAV